nr:Dihydrofolate reductase [uncultured bacterium]
MKVILIAALSADGLLGRNTDDFSMDWTSPEDVQLFVRITKEAGVIVMGSRTFATTVAAGRKLPGRKMVVYTSRGHMDHDRKDATEFTSDDPAVLLKRLSEEGYESVAVCGGAAIYDMFLREGLVDELYITYEPILFGTGIALAHSSFALKLRLLETKQLNENTCMMHYEVQK